MTSSERSKRLISSLISYLYCKMDKQGFTIEEVLIIRMVILIAILIMVMMMITVLLLMVELIFLSS